MKYPSRLNTWISAAVSSHGRAPMLSDDPAVTKNSRRHPRQLNASARAQRRRRRRRERERRPPRAPP
eukprot:COSAG03_NODE_11904_length_571_cov_0.711864_1_plen_66_part_10